MIQALKPSQFGGASTLEGASPSVSFLYNAFPGQALLWLKESLPVFSPPHWRMAYKHIEQVWQFTQCSEGQ